jgi:hypothetical protein
VRQRLGQGAFRVLVTDAYERRCAVTGEKALPVLQAAHIRPVTKEGTHQLDNGLLLRSDIHALFDQGYVTVTPDHRFWWASGSRRTSTTASRITRYLEPGSGFQDPARTARTVSCSSGMLTWCSRADAARRS